MIKQFPERELLMKEIIKHIPAINDVTFVSEPELTSNNLNLNVNITYKNKNFILTLKRS